MAGDCIHIRHDLSNDPAVISIAESVARSPDEVVGKLCRFWSWSCENTITGYVKGITQSRVDEFLDAPGFAQAMVDVGWLVRTERGVVIPKFGRHLSRAAKKRATTAARVRSHRALAVDPAQVMLLKHGIKLANVTSGVKLDNVTHGALQKEKRKFPPPVYPPSSKRKENSRRAAAVSQKAQESIAPAVGTKPHGGDVAMSGVAEHTPNAPRPADAARTSTAASSGGALDALERHGVGEPTRSQIIEDNPGVTAELIDQACQSLGQSAGPGLRVNALRDRLPGLIRDQAESEQRRVVARANLAELEPHLQREFEANTVAVETAFAALTESEREDLEIRIRLGLSVQLGGGPEALRVAEAWLASQEFSGAVKLLFCGHKRTQDREREAEAARQEAARKEPEQRRRDERKAAKARVQARQAAADKERAEKDWWDSLDDAKLVALFRQLAREASNHLFRERWASETPDPKTIRKKFRTQLTLKFGPGGTGATSPAKPGNDALIAMQEHGLNEGATP